MFFKFYAQKIKITTENINIFKEFQKDSYLPFGVDTNADTKACRAYEEQYGK